MSAPTEVGPLSLPLPSNWERIESSDNVVVLAAPEVPDARFRPNIVLTTALADGPLDVVSSNAIASILALQPRAQVFAVEPNDLDDVLGVPSRTVEWGYEAERTTVLVRQWIAVIGRYQVHVTGSCAVEEFIDFVPFFRSVLAAASIADAGADGDEPSDRPADGSDAPDDSMPASPRIDPGASDRIGTTLEALDGVVLAQPRAVGRWMLSDGALQHLWTLRGRGIISRGKRRSPEGVELAEAGLTGALGALAGDGQRIANLLERPGYRYGAAADHAGRSVDWSMWLGGDTALVRARGNVVDLVDDRLRADTFAQYDVVPAGRAVGHLLAWARISPAWAIASDDEIVLPAEVVDARIASVGMPDGAAPISGFVADRLWREPVWVRLRVWGDRTPYGLDVIAAGAAGWFRRDALDDGRVRLEPMPSGSVLRSVLAVFSAPGGSDAQ
ncbi:hypothetical protein [Curtobacterium pusillum]|uniref:hypothetical protein n=1 Tax=Curtobacterium pusillum TaxID=69373 RepID=UPI0011A68C65|nr:hypothetical protein [Curtobacterium pusillum]